MKPQQDIIEEVLFYFRANVFFRNFENFTFYWGLLLNIDRSVKTSAIATILYIVRHAMQNKNIFQNKLWS